MLKLGITGNLGSGKSTVALMFQKLGAERIDVDGLAHQILNEDEKVKKSLVKFFGSGICDDGRINRQVLAQLVFHDPDALYLLESIIHPVLTKKIQGLLQSYQKQKTNIVIVDAAILIEAGWAHLVDQIILITAPKNLQIQRAIRRTRLSKTEILKRLACQMPVMKKKYYADFVIHNNESQKKLNQKIKQLWRKLS